MPVNVPCPDGSVLQQFRLGQLPPDEVEALTAHVVRCDQCSQVLEKLKATSAQMEAEAGVELGSGTSPTAEVTPPPHDPWATIMGPPEQVERYDFLLPPEQPGELGRLGPYRVVRVLGAGGMGVVFQAFDPQLQRQVALKVMKPGTSGTSLARQRFLREARAMAALEHDHIVPVYQVGADRDVPFLAMPFLKGENLEDRIHREGKLPVAEVLRIGREIAEGLAAAHEAGLVHRDIKPSNVWLEGSRGRVKVLDFGLARPMDDANPLSHSGMIAGTPHYMAPEQAKGEDVDHRCDLFSLGSVLYRLSTGQLPFPGKNQMGIMYAVATDAPKAARELAPELPPALTALIEKLMAKRPEDRPASAKEVVEAIGKIEEQFKQEDRLAERPAETSARTTAKLRVRGPVRRWLGVAAAVLFLTVFLGITTFLSNRKGTVVVTAMEPDVKVFVDGQEKLTIDSTKMGRFELAAGEHQLVVMRDAEEVYKKTFELKSGAVEPIDARWESNQTRNQDTVREGLPTETVVVNNFDGKPETLAKNAREILKKHCFECHGQNPTKLRKGLNVLDYERLLSSKKNIVVPKKPNDSRLIKRMDDEDDPMPPPEKPRVPEADRKLLQLWIAAGAPAFSATEEFTDDTLPPSLKDTPVEAKENAEIRAAAQKKLAPAELTKMVKEIFRNRCLECHGGREKKKGIEILNHKLLLDKKLVVADKPGESDIYSVILDDSMPKGPNKLSSQDKRRIFDWIEQGAPAFDEDKKFLPGIGNVDYVLKLILEDVAKISKRSKDELAYMRYFSSNHLLNGGTAEDVLAQQADALVKTINHLSLEPEIYRPEVIDPGVNSVFRVDIRKLGWHQRLDQIKYGKAAGPSKVTIYDLALLEYPYGIIHADNKLYVPAHGADFAADDVYNVN